MAVQPSGNEPDPRIVSESHQEIHRQNVRFLLKLGVGLLLLMLLLLWLAGGLWIIDHHYYKRISDNSNSLPFSFELDVYPTDHVTNFAGLIEWDVLGAPHRPRIETKLDLDSTFEKIRFEVVRVTYPNGSESVLLSQERILYDLKSPDSLFDPREFARTIQQENLEKIYWRHEVLPVDLQLNLKQHKTCTVQIEGVLIDASGRETPFSVSGDFQSTGYSTVVFKYIAQMQV